jgi:hypothetical protein
VPPSTSPAAVTVFRRRLCCLRLRPSLSFVCLERSGLVPGLDRQELPGLLRDGGSTIVETQVTEGLIMAAGHRMDDGTREAATGSGELPQPGIPKHPTGAFPRLRRLPPSLP